MSQAAKISRKAVSILLLLATMASFITACSDSTPKTTLQTGTTPPSSTESALPTIFTGENEMYPSSNYVEKYGDVKSMSEWLDKNMTSTNLPPVTFKVNGKSSRDYSWEKSEGEIQRVVYFEKEENPSLSHRQTITYRCSELEIRIELTLISYSNYPVVEYEATLYNEADGNSKRISNLLAADYTVEDKEGDYFLHASRGANTQYNDFEPLSYRLKGTKGFAVTNGKPTSTYLPYFNLENKVNNTGVISILNWQGNWKADFVNTNKGVTLKAGQHTTDLVLLKGENMDFPGMVLLFYKGDYINGQNVYRRWLYCCNQFREQGERMKETNVLVCPSQYNIIADKRAIDMYVDTGLTEYIDKYNIDGGWYDTEGNTWYYTGNWFTKKSAYPAGIKQLSKMVHNAGLKFAVWYEPERVAWGTWTTDQLKDMGGLIVVGSNGKALTDYSKVAKGNCEVILDYSNPAVVKWVVDLLNSQIKENGIDQYRQDFNTFPAPHWKGLDLTRSAQLGIARTGYTENKYCKGYLDVYAGILAENPLLYVDACASGGMRNDLSTIRYSFMHTRSDYWSDIESAQLQTYGSSMWFMYWGTGFSSADLNSYDVRSHIGNSIGVGISNKSQAEGLKNALTEWKHLAGYLFWDYYPLTDYAGNTKQTMSIQYDSPEEKKGMFITYFRKNDTATICPRGLDPKALYQIWDMDNKQNSLVTKTGEEIMAGITITSKASSAVVYEYCLAEGQDTTAFQKENVATGKGSNGYDPDAKNGKIVDVKPPVVTDPYVNTMADDVLVKLYDINSDGKISLIATDFRSTGLVYAISPDLYEGLPFTSTEVDGWKAINKSKMYISISGSTFAFTTWDGNGAMFKNVQPLAKKIGNCYFLWISNILPFADDDGQWKNCQCVFSWDKTTGGKASGQAYIDFSSSGGRIKLEGKDSYTEKGRIFKIDRQIYQSFCYTGKGVAYGDVIWNEIDLKTVGIATVAEKAPATNTNIQSITKWLSTLEAEGVGVYTRQDGDNYYMWIKEIASVEKLSVCQAQVKRAVFVWKDSNGAVLQQSMLFPA